MYFQHDGLKIIFWQSRETVTSTTRNRVKSIQSPISSSKRESTRIVRSNQTNGGHGMISRVMLFALLFLTASIAGEIRLKALGNVEGVAQDTIGDIRTNLAYLALLPSFQLYFYMFPDLFIDKQSASRFQLKNYQWQYEYAFKDQRLKNYLLLPLPFQLGVVGFVLDKDRSRSKYLYSSSVQIDSIPYKRIYESGFQDKKQLQQFLYAFTPRSWLAVAYGFHRDQNTSEYRFQSIYYKFNGSPDTTYIRRYFRKSDRPRNKQQLAFLITLKNVEGGIQLFAGKNQGKVFREYMDYAVRPDTVLEKKISYQEVGENRLTGIHGNWRLRWGKNYLISGWVKYDRMTEEFNTSQFAQHPTYYWYSSYFFSQQRVPTTVNTRYSRQDTRARIGFQWRKSTKTFILGALSVLQMNRDFSRYLKHDLSQIDPLGNYVRYTDYNADRQDTQWTLHLGMQSRLSESIQLWFGSQTIYVQSRIRHAIQIEYVEKTQKRNYSYNFRNVRTDFNLGFHVQMTRWLSFETVLNFQYYWFIWYYLREPESGLSREEPNDFDVRTWAENRYDPFPDNFPAEFSVNEQRLADPGAYYDTYRRGYYNEFIYYPYLLRPNRSIEVSLYIHL